MVFATVYCFHAINYNDYIYMDHFNISKRNDVDEVLNRSLTSQILNTEINYFATALFIAVIKSHNVPNP